MQAAFIRVELQDGFLRAHSAFGTVKIIINTEIGHVLLLTKEGTPILSGK